MQFQSYSRVRPIDLKSGDAIAVKVVAVIGHDADWAAYMGPTDWSDEQVAREGDKIYSPETAAGLFPQVARAELRYRR